MMSSIDGTETELDKMAEKEKKSNTNVLEEEKKSDAEEDDDTDEDEEEEEDEETGEGVGMTSAYSVTDLLDGLDESESKTIEKSEDLEVKDEAVSEKKLDASKENKTENPEEVSGELVVDVDAKTDVVIGNESETGDAAQEKRELPVATTQAYTEGNFEDDNLLHYTDIDVVKQRKRDSVLSSARSSLISGVSDDVASDSGTTSDLQSQCHSLLSTSSSERDTEAQTKVVADIGGRFHSLGLSGKSENSTENGPEKSGENNTKERSGSPVYYNESVDNAGTIKEDREPIYDDVAGMTLRGEPTLRNSEVIYENIGGANGTLGKDDDGWGSSEFESYDESETSRGGSVERSSASLECNGGAAPDLPPRTVSKVSKRGRPRSTTSPEVSTPRTPGAVFDRLASRLQPRLSVRKDEEEEEEEEDFMVMDAFLDMDKHPPAKLPDQPEGLDPLQIQRRHIVSTIVESEKNYTSSLRRIVEDYEKPLLQTKPHIISRTSVKVIFHKVKDILQCHNMFQIELAEYIRLWDTDEKIGNVFTASFSKGMVFDAYSAFVNNFSIAMDTAKKQARSKQAFADFLKQKQGGAIDKLSLFGLMVKPVQRFPQFIMLLQDLLKYTPLHHHDRLPLQMALTELENLTHKLNETKRESESRHDVKKILNQLTGRHSVKPDAERHMIRQDDMTQIDQSQGETKTKTRRLFLMNDQLMCVTVLSKETDSGPQERFRLKWCVPLTDLDLVETGVVSPYNVKSGHGKTSVTKQDKSTAVSSVSVVHPYKKEVDDLLHDLPIVEQISQLVSQLRNKYQGLNLPLVHSVTRTLQVMIQQKSDVDRCILRLSLPLRAAQTQSDKFRDEVTKQVNKRIKKHSAKVYLETSPERGSGRVVFTFQVETVALKQDWLLQLNNARLALDPRNNPSWYLPEHETQFLTKLPLFVKPLPIDITKQDNKVQCGIPVVLPSSEQPGVGTQHLWVCSGDSGGQVTIVSFHGNQPHAVESFEVSKSVIVCVEMVPGFSTCEDKFAFKDNTVWMATEDKKLILTLVEEDNRSDSRVRVTLSHMATSLLYHNNHVYAGLSNGTLNIYLRDKEGVWQMSSPVCLVLGSAPVPCLLTVHSEVWAACGGNIHVVTMTGEGEHKPGFEFVTHQVAAAEEGVIECMVRAGVGLVVSFKGRATLRLHHMETLEQLQEVNLATAIRTVLEGQQPSTEMQESLKRVSVTCVCSCRGLLWVGTSVGCIVTLPLPRLEGVPQLKGRPHVAYHAHTGSVKFLSGLVGGAVPVPTYVPPSVSQRSSQADESCVPSDSCADPKEDGSAEAPVGAIYEDLSEGARDFSQSSIYENLYVNDDDGVGELVQHRWTSTPDLRLAQAESMEDELHLLYGSLLKGMDDEIDVDLDLMKVKRKGKIPNLGMVSSKMSKMAKAMNMMGTSQDQRCATLPILVEDHNTKQTTSKGQGHPDRSHAGHVTGRAISQDCQAVLIEDDVASTETGDSASTGDTPAEGSVASLNQDPPPAPLRDTSRAAQPSNAHVSPLTNCHLVNRAPMIVSGGEGHINWSQSQAEDAKYEDICLLLWQCRV